MATAAQVSKAVLTDLKLAFMIISFQKWFRLSLQFGTRVTSGPVRMVHETCGVGQ